MPQPASGSCLRFSYLKDCGAFGVPVLSFVFKTKKSICLTWSPTGPGLNIKFNGTWTLCRWLPKGSALPSENLLEDPNEALQTIGTETITETGLNKSTNGNHKRRIVRTEGVNLPDGNIAHIKDSYKYLWILQRNGNLEEVARMSHTVKYLQTCPEDSAEWKEQIPGTNAKLRK